MFDLVQTLDFGTDVAKSRVMDTKRKSEELVSRLADMANTATVGECVLGSNPETGRAYMEHTKYGRVTRFDIREVSEPAEGEHGWSEEQIEKLTWACNRFGVEFNVEHYRRNGADVSCCPPGSVEGHVGGDPAAMYLSVERNGDSHS